MSNWETLVEESVLQKAIESLIKNGISTEVCATAEQAKERVLQLIPKGSEVFTYTSTTLDQAGISKEINESGNYDSVRNKLYSMDGNTQGREMRKLGAAPDFGLGSVHAVTEDGSLLIASGTGSQLPAYSYSAGKMIWVVSTKKIVKNLDEGIKRIYEYVLPLENDRANKAYNITTGSSVGKLLVINKERAGRLHLVFIQEKLGF